MKILKSYYIESTNRRVIRVDGIINAKEKDAIRKQWRQQDHTAGEAIVLDQSITPFDSLVNQVPLSILKQLSKLLNNQS